jgi:hypothetical protein
MRRMSVEEIEETERDHADVALWKELLWSAVLVGGVLLYLLIVGALAV